MITSDDIEAKREKVFHRTISQKIQDAVWRWKFNRAYLKDLKSGSGSVESRLAICRTYNRRRYFWQKEIPLESIR